MTVSAGSDVYVQCGPLLAESSTATSGVHAAPSSLACSSKRDANAPSHETRASQTGSGAPRSTAIQWMHASLPQCALSHRVPNCPSKAIDASCPAVELDALAVFPSARLIISSEKEHAGEPGGGGDGGGGDGGAGEPQSACSPALCPATVPKRGEHASGPLR